jgi:hypothetical protein
VDNRITLKAIQRGTPTVSSGRKVAVLGAGGRVRRTPPGSQSGAGLHRGSSGTWESHLSPGHMPGRGDRVTKGPGGVWEFRPEHEPVRATPNGQKQARDRGASAKRRVPRGAERLSERSIVPGKVGNAGPPDPREGRRRRAARGAGQKDGRDLESTNRHPTTPAQCGAGRPRSRSRVDDVGPPDRRRLSPGGVVPHE